MVLISVDNNGGNIKIGAKGNLSDIGADLLVGLICFYEEMKEKNGEEFADTFFTILKENLDLVKNRKEILKQIDELEKEICPLDELISELKSVRKKLSEFEKITSDIKEKQDDKK